MATIVPEEVKKYGGYFAKGIVAEMAPQILKGSLVELMKIKRVDVKKASEWVQTNTRLWDVIEPNQRKALLKLGEHVKNLDWLTKEWVIGAFKEDLPALASLFLGWKKGGNWLGRQVEIIRKEIGTRE